MLFCFDDAGQGITRLIDLGVKFILLGDRDLKDVKHRHLPSQST